MRYLKSYNESLYNDDKYIGNFIEKILSHQSKDFTNLRLRHKNWEQRDGYPDRIAIDYTNNIIDESESIILENIDGGLRIYINGTFYKDIRPDSVRLGNDVHIDSIFKAISNKSNNRKKHEVESSLVKKILNNVNEEIIKGYFADVLELANDYKIKKSLTYKTETHWEISMNIPGLINTSDLATKQVPKITIDDKNRSILESILSVSKILKESEGLSTTIEIIDGDLRIKLNAIDPDTGKILFN